MSTSAKIDFFEEAPVPPTAHSAGWRLGVPDIIGLGVPDIIGWLVAPRESASEDQRALARGRGRIQSRCSARKWLVVARFKLIRHAACETSAW